MSVIAAPSGFDGFTADAPGAIVRRLTPGVRLFGMGEMQHEHALMTTGRSSGIDFEWGRVSDGTRSLASSILSSCLGDVGGGENLAETLSDPFAHQVLALTAADASLRLPWLEVHRWLSGQGVEESKSLVSLVGRVSHIEGLIADAVASKAQDQLQVDPQLWTEWAIRVLLGVLIAHRRCPPENLRGFIDRLLDVKFKLYCLLEADLSAYAAALQVAGLSESDPHSTPQGHLIRLSSEATVAVKSRAIWESVMDAVYWFERGDNLRPVAVSTDTGERYKSKARAFFNWVAAQPDWAPLRSFEPLVSQHDDRYRTPEIHGPSRLRGDFTAGRLAPLGPQLQLLNAVLHYTWDHLAEVAAFGKPITYDAAAGTPIHIDLS